MKKNLLGIFLISFFSMTMALSSCENKVDGFEFPSYDIDEDENNDVVELEKDDYMDIDGVLDEYEWIQAKNNAYSVVNADLNDVRLESMCHLGEKGVYFGVIVDDFAVYYNKERRASRNTSVEVHFKGFGNLDTKAHCIRIVPTGDGVKVDMKDTSWRLNLNGVGAMQWMTSPFKWQGAAYVKGNINTSTCEGYVCEAFVPWEVLGVENHKYIRTYTAFNHVETNSLDGDRIWTGTAGCGLTKPNTWKIVSNEGFALYEDIMDELVITDQDMEIDGKLDEPIWSEVNVADFDYTTKSNTEIKFSAKSYMTDRGAYFGFEVKDKYIYYADESVRPIGLNSGMEILFAPYGVEEITPECLQLRITANNVKLGYSGVVGASYPWAYDQFDMLSATTIQDNEGLGGLNTNKNEGYTIELFIPWTSFGSNERLDGLMVLPNVVHSENNTQSAKMSPWDYCNVTNANVAGQINPQEHFIFMDEEGAVLRRMDVPNLFFTDEMFNEETNCYEYRFDVEAKFVTLNERAFSNKFKVSPEFNLPKNVTLVKEENDTFVAKVKKEDINNFKDGVGFEVELNGKQEKGKIYYAKVSLDGNPNDSMYGRSYKTLTNVSANVIEQEVSTYFDEKGIFVAFKVKDAIIRNKSHVETFFTLGDEIQVGNTWQIRCYPLSNTYKTYVYQIPDKDGWAWGERTGNSILDVIVDADLTEDGYNVELFIPYGTFGLQAAPEKLHILPCISYFEDAETNTSSQYHNQSGVSNKYTWDRSKYVSFDSKGYIPERINVQDIYLTNRNYKDGYYTCDLICLDDQDNQYEIKEVLGDNAKYFVKNSNNQYELKISADNLEEVLASPIQVKVENGNIYDLSVISLSKQATSAYVDFSNGAITNSGADSTLLANAVKIENKEFVTTADVTYTNGVDGDENGAILTNYKKGAYANIKDINFGTNDFTISTWIYIPETTTISTGNSSYIFGTSNCDGCTDGFRVTLRYTTVGYSFNIRSSYSENATLVVAPTMSKAQWHNVVLVRDSNKLYLYVDSTLLVALTIAEDTNFTSTVLNFGAYINETWGYHDGTIAFDNIAVYNKSIDASGVEAIFINKI